jgi:ABC-type amino acid transport/signal transduction systems, periplasmic component/domain
MGTRQRFVNTLEEGLEAVRKGYVDALIHDRPLLKYLIKDLDKQEFMIVDKGFAESTYGITFPQGSPDKELIDVALLKAMEGGSNSVYSIFHRKWFGE